MANDDAGIPDFDQLQLRNVRPGALHLWAFELLELNGRDTRGESLTKRQHRLQGLLTRFGCPAIQASECFNDGLALLAAAEKHGLEGVVSKRRNAPYRSGECKDWRKVKTKCWREANRDRWALFQMK